MKDIICRIVLISCDFILFILFAFVSVLFITALVSKLWAASFALSLCWIICTLLFVRSMVQGFGEDGYYKK